MSSGLYDELVELDAATRFQLAQDLLDSISSEAFSLLVTDDQRNGLRARLAVVRYSARYERARFGTGAR